MGEGRENFTRMNQRAGPMTAGAREDRTNSQQPGVSLTSFKVKGLQHVVNTPLSEVSETRMHHVPCGPNVEPVG